MLKFCDRVVIAPVSNAEAMSPEDQTARIKEFVETVISIEKEAAGLGLRIVGGSDTYLGGVVVNLIEPRGAAAKDGRLAIGDQILMVNGVSLRKASHKDAVSSLRIAVSPVKLTILREDPEKIFTSTDEPSAILDVKVVKPISDYLGLSVLARKDRKGVFVTYVAEGSIAYKEGSIQQGDRLLEVNGVDLNKATQDEASHVLRRAYGSVKLKIGRIPSLYASLSAAKTKASYINHGLEDDRVLSKEFRRWNSFGFEHKKKRKIPREMNDAQAPTRRRSVSCRDFNLVSENGLGGVGRASSVHDIKGPSQQDTRNNQPHESFRYVHPDRIDLSFQDLSNQPGYQREDYV